MACLFTRSSDALAAIAASSRVPTVLLAIRELGNTQASGDSG
jgi:hypothetical protein